MWLSEACGGGCDSRASKLPAVGDAARTAGVDFHLRLLSGGGGEVPRGVVRAMPKEAGRFFAVGGLGVLVRHGRSCPGFGLESGARL